MSPKSNNRRVSVFSQWQNFSVVLSRNNGTEKFILQEARLSQKDRAMLRVIEYFAKSLKVAEWCYMYFQ